ncbi:MAG: cutinase family protein [Nocardiaceae bacterium]|nr:cutinase family protein [Nocardiaceae bacterium]
MNHLTEKPARSTPTWSARTITIAMTAVAIIVGTLTPSNTPAANAEGGQSGPVCSDVRIIGLAGSGERKNPNEHRGMGRYVDETVKFLEDSLRNKGYTVSVTAVPYQAMAVPPLDWRSASAWNNFRGSIQDGISKFDDILREPVHDRLCKNEKTVVVGYSQGALVAHRVLQNIQRANSFCTVFEICFPPRTWSGTTLGKIAGVFLLADPDRINGDNVQGNNRGTGTAQAFPSFSGSSKLKFDSKWSSKTVETVCALNDVVCDFAAAARLAGSDKFKKLGETAHTSYKSATWNAQFAIFVLKNLPRKTFPPIEKLPPINLPPIFGGA